MPLIPNADYEAYAQNKENQYVRWINEKSNYDYFKLLSHEIIHIKQYYHNELIIDGLYVIWMGEFFEYEELEYEDRPWENEAYNYSNELMSAIKKLL